MASIEQRGRTFRIVFRYRGRRFTRSLRTANEKQATATLARLEDNLRRVELGTLSIPEGSDVATFLLSDGRQSAKRERSEIRTLSQLMASYFDNIPTDSLEENTLTGMRIHQRHLERLLGESLPIRALQFDDLQTYVDRRSKEPGQHGHTIRPATIKKELRTLTSVWNWAIDMRIVSSPLPKRRLRYPKTTEKPRFQTWQEIERRIRRGDLTEDQQAELWHCLFLTIEEIGDVLGHVQEAARHPFIYPMFCFAAHTGARRSEMLRSQIDDIDFYSKSITIREKKRVRGTVTTRTVPLSPELERVLSNWFDNHPGGSHTFCQRLQIPYSTKQRETYEPLTKDEAVTHFRCTLDGSKWEKIRGWHTFRHSFCSNCASAGIDQRFINTWVGHQTEEMVRRYRHLIPNQQLQEIQRVFVPQQPRIHIDQPSDVADASELVAG